MVRTGNSPIERKFKIQALTPLDVIVPNARWDCLNLLVFVDAVDVDGFEIKRTADIDWDAWRDKLR